MKTQLHRNGCRFAVPNHWQICTYIITKTLLFVFDLSSNYLILFCRQIDYKKEFENIELNSLTTSNILALDYKSYVNIIESTSNNKEKN